MPYRVLLSVVLFLLPSVARASTPTGQLLGHSMECIVDQGVSEFDIPTNPDVITALYFPKNIAHARLPRHAPRDFNIKWDRNAVYIRPHSARRDAVTNLVVKTSDSKMQVSLFVHRTDDPGKALRTCRFVGRDAVESEQARIKAAVKVETAELKTKLVEEQQNQILIAELAALKEALIKPQELRPVVREISGNRGEVEIRLGRGIFFKGQFWTAFLIDNSRSWRPYRLGHVQTTDRSGLVSPIPRVYVDAPATRSDGNLAEIPAGALVQGFMMLPGVTEGMDFEAITFRGSSGPHTLVAAMQDPIWVWVPKREEEVEREKRDRQALGVVSLYLQALGGLIWLKDGLGLDRLDATTMTGGSVRVAYGLTALFAFEAGILGAGSRTSRFGDVMWNGTQGELERSAALGRAHIGAALRVGSDWYIPTARLGIGFQGTRQGARFVPTAGEPMEGPESEFVVDTMLTAGAGIDIKLGSLLAGIALSGVHLLDAGFQSIEAGIHLGYSWQP